MDKSKAYSVAKKRTKAKFAFIFHLSVYVSISLFLIFINVETSFGYLWCKWPMTGWGVGLLLHGIFVFFLADYSDLKNRMIEREAQKLMDDHLTSESGARD